MYVALLYLQSNLSVYWTIYCYIYIFFITYQIFPKKHTNSYDIFWYYTVIHSKYYINVKFKLVFNAKFLDRIYLYLMLCYGYFYVNTCFLLES